MATVIALALTAAACGSDTSSHTIEAGADAVDLVATNVASFPDRVSPGGTFSAPLLYERRALRIRPADASFYTRIDDFVGKRVGVVQGPDLYAQFAAGQLDAVAEAEYYARDGTVIPSHGPDVVLIDHHDLIPGAREESVFVVRDKSQGLLEAVNSFIASTKFPL
ncbi:MAG: hypothetical protein ABI880_14355 [Acidobacteriota bacterium]